MQISHYDLNFKITFLLLQFLHPLKIFLLKHTQFNEFLLLLKHVKLTVVSSHKYDTSSDAYHKSDKSNANIHDYL